MVGGRLAVSTDWTPSGSMNLLRELRCVDSFNQDHLARYFDDLDIFRMVTEWSAAATATDDAIGRLQEGWVADIAIFGGLSDTGSPYRTVIEADPEDVHLVLRGASTLRRPG